ncbi:MAG: peptidoglycan-binding protein [Coriobacteriia bacterium]|nr:peptidoglycan-binding protein [Coriobacteriia bacterium]
MQEEREVHSELAIHDLQRRLTLLGYRLGEEAEKGLFGELTASAVTSFKVSNGLGSDDTLDQNTWTALKDATMQMGDRPLYLHIPHFRGRDVAELQAALSSMGFPCFIDTSFGGETEQALGEFQKNMGLGQSGILDTETLQTIQRLRHIWDGKRGIYLEGRRVPPTRPQEVLEATSVCVFGIDEPTRVIANKVANLARATTINSRVLCATALETAPKKDMLLVGLRLLSEPEDQKVDTKKQKRAKSGLFQKPTKPPCPEAPCAYLSSGEEFTSQLTEAIQTARGGTQRVTIIIDTLPQSSEDLTLQRQIIAAQVLDALCQAQQ